MTIKLTKKDGNTKLSIKGIETMTDVQRAIDYLEEHKKLWKTIAV